VSLEALGEFGQRMRRHVHRPVDEVHALVVKRPAQGQGLLAVAAAQLDQLERMMVRADPLCQLVGALAQQVVLDAGEVVPAGP
jgi:hypothetical protein